MTEQPATYVQHRALRIRYLAFFMAPLLVFPAGSCFFRKDNLPPAPIYPITIGSKTLPIPVALDEAHRKRGLMYRKQLGPDEGMLFVFPRVNTLYFWTQNTHVPLSVAFISAEGRVIQIVDMEPLDLTKHRSRMPVKYGLEMPKGWFARNNVKEGDMVKIPEAVAKQAAN